jgi:hypothetical protein
MLTCVLDARRGFRMAGAAEISLFVIPSEFDSSKKEAPPKRSLFSFRREP